MSVICQNFVQNAWKKDLCSNCFKSVGDHESIDIVEDSQSSNPNSNNQNGIYVSQSSNVHTVRSETPPHTTWKSLISEKNGKNSSQPFKLENGFQGRLLTINKALNGTDKQHSSDGSTKNKANSEIYINGLAKTSNGVSRKQPVGKSENLQYSKQNGSNVKKGNNLSNGQMSDEKKRITGGSVQTTIINKQKNLNGHSNVKLEKRKDLDKKRNEANFTESNSDEVIQGSTNLHSILKKNSTPLDKGGQVRRGSNVGFKDEEPIVIGYGGRDFSPEELDWEVASDCEVDGTSDSLDETEDDKVFSKMTKQNTEFNSDNANLLENIKRNDQKCSNVKETKSVGHEESSRSVTISDCRQETPQHSRNEVLNMNSKRPEKGDRQDDKNKNCVNERQDNVQSDPEKIGECCDSSPKANSVKVKSVHSDINNTNESMNVAIKSDKTGHAVKTNEETAVVKTTKAADSRVDVKNSPALVNGAAPPSRSVDSCTETESGKTADSEMFSDGVEPTWQENSTEEQHKEWQDSDSVPGQILQAINTSLTNRHKMRESPALNTDAEERNIDYDKEHTDNDTNKISVSVNNEVANNRHSDAERNIEIVTDGQENTPSIEPRESFLHGIVSKPSAIYGPASDLFVSRSNSSSSSSSDEQRKSQISLSINVIMNGGDNQTCNENADAENDVNEDSVPSQDSVPEKPAQASLENKTKPEIPVKPSKQLTTAKLEQYNVNYKSKLKDEAPKLVDTRKCENATEEVLYYSSIPGERGHSTNLVDPYAESNIYQEVSDKYIKVQEDESTAKVPARESKLAALAIELEQVRHTSGSTKRQAPAPPKVPDPPLEDPPSCAGRVSPMSDVPHTFSSFRGESLGFSSASSTTSTSSQDTEAGYASWTLHGESDDHPKHKSKSSFILTQYSKCKMLAMGYAEDSARARKRFSIKKLLKLGKETEAPATFDPNCPNPKAWKYSDHFERPRAKLEIIHPMDLENKSVTVNPGFESLHSGNMSSFSANSDDASFRNSVSSDYGSFYSDILSPNQDPKQEVNYEYIQPRLPITDEQEETCSKTGTSNSTSPTPSRSSTASQASTVTSGSSKNSSSHRPPKPPPPPRAHSLLPGNKVVRNLDGTFKFPVINGDTSSSDEVTVAPSKPQAPRRQCKSAIIRSEYTNLDDQKNPQNLQQDIMNPNEDLSENYGEDENKEGNHSKSTSILINHSETSQNQQDESQSYTSISNDNSTLTKSDIHEDVTATNSSVREGVYDNLMAEKESKIQTSITIKTGASIQRDKLSKSMLSRNKHPPLTKSPARPPPIYSKPQSANLTKNLHPWKTLEDSYIALTSSNRELLIRLVNQALKKKKNFSSKLSEFQFQWTDFEIDGSQPSSVFAFGEKIAYHATMPKWCLEYAFTLVISLVQQDRLQENSEMKYPVLGKFTDYIPSELLDNSTDSELESLPATVLVLDRSNISTIECFSESISESLTEENEKELCFIILQLIQSLKSLQVQGIESIDSNFRNLLLAKTKLDKYHTLIFLYDNCYDENDFSSDSCKISLCQYTLMLLFQILKIHSIDEALESKFSSNMSQKVFETAFSLLSEEKAVSLSQTKTLFECYLWGVTKVLESFQNSEDCDSILHRWLDIERSNFIKSIVDEEFNDLNVQNEYYSQFLIRTNARNIKEVASYL